MEENIDPRNWFGRNWKWVVPTGGCLLIIILFIVFAASMILGISSLFNNSEPHKEALFTAQNDEYVIEALGEPIKLNGSSKGSINYTNGDGYCNLEIRIKGPKGEAVISLIATSTSDIWEYQMMEVMIEETGNVIALKPSNNQLKD